MREPEQKTERRRVIAVIGGASESQDANTLELASELGRRVVDAGHRLVTGGLGGVMRAASRGGHLSARWRDGDVLGVIPSYDRESANEHVDIVIPTGMEIARNVIVVAMADVVVAIGGGAGTLSEMAIAWQLGRPLIALSPSGGWAERLAGEQIDHRRSDRILHAHSLDEVMAALADLLARPGREAGTIGSGWKQS